jgi:hypothetical protein
MLSSGASSASSWQRVARGDLFFSRPVILHVLGIKTATSHAGRHYAKPGGEKNIPNDRMKF